MAADENLINCTDHTERLSSKVMLHALALTSLIHHACWRSVKGKHLASKSLRYVAVPLAAHVANCYTCHCQYTCWPTLPLSLRCQSSAITQQIAWASAMADVAQPTQPKSGMVLQPAQLRPGFKLLSSSENKDESV